MEIVLSICLGVGLSAACGFRVFVPFLIVSMASLSGHLELSDGFTWMGTWPALLVFAVATVFEIAAYYVPWVDNLLDTVATPAAVVAGVVLTASVLGEVSPLLRWSLALIAGGGVAGIVQVSTDTVRLTSTATTGGLANPIVSTAEAGASAVMSVVSIVIPLLAAVLVIGLALLIFRLLFGRRRYRQTV